MSDPRSSCFPGAANATPPATTAAGPTLITSVYETQMGLAALTWSRTVLGLSLRTEIHLPCLSSFCSASSPVSSSTVSLSDVDTFAFRFNPWILWKRRGTKRFHVKDKDHHHQQKQYWKVDFAWDLSRACFSTTGGPEPTSGFFVAVAVDGDMFLIVGDMPEEEVYKNINLKKSVLRKSSSFIKGSPGNPILVSRSEHVFLHDSNAGRPYTTNTNTVGRQREISIALGGRREKDAKLCIGLDGKRVLLVKRLRWKFRGNERVKTVSKGGGGRIQVSWDVHNWFFNSAGGGRTTNSDDICQAHATFVFRFDRNEAEKRQLEKFGSGGGQWGTFGFGHYGNIDRSLRSSSTIGCGGGRRKRRRKQGPLKTSSTSSSASKASSASSSSVLAWASAEEKELKEPDGFFLLVYIWKR